MIYRDLETDPASFGAIIADRHLAADQFASTHHETIRRHYARSGVYALDKETALQAAVDLLNYLRPSPRQRTLHRFDH
ncbi:hypothetical protein [Thiobaca trueperi]|uniref:Uncharacterized protein n=1 Tax=Thiobaca trueperi TaxID=127458 RepID=A0A4V2V1W6_9GAMM|nr:hypothetical protein [Thiobaca trueperi]TCT22742.1 hypothetical protein EDC35_10273 [Thiobaca trueperi]